MGGFPGSSLLLCSESLWSGLHLPQVGSEIVPHLLTGNTSVVKNKGAGFKRFQCLQILSFKIRVKPEIAVGLCNKKKTLVQETSHSITEKRSWRSIRLDERFVPGENGKKKGAITAARVREECRTRNE
ncbi:hypothetical protein CEXT_741151 [Caerostris extrusa]|uniref:Uncharacterized protein n=1 Tax=Caerostris extrusa TaxID=172846 RepID=A0AAV4SPT5_CAEEX|nr:hypothetical protein CEXT_741151 [Caerostris extrusa]